MLWRKSADLAAGGVRIVRAQWTVGTLYDSDLRKNTPGWGAAIELPVVFELLSKIQDGRITAEQARQALSPVLADLAVFNREVEALDDLIGR